jgi:hypothetical protein
MSKTKGDSSSGFIQIKFKRWSLPEKFEIVEKYKAAMSDIVRGVHASRGLPPQPSPST